MDEGLAAGSDVSCLRCMLRIIVLATAEAGKYLCLRVEGRWRNLQSQAYRILFYNLPFLRPAVSLLAIWTQFNPSESTSKSCGWFPVVMHEVRRQGRTKRTSHQLVFGSPRMEPSTWQGLVPWHRHRVLVLFVVEYSVSSTEY